MFSVLLAIIYLSFISLGLPDSMLGAAWPVMREVFGVSLSYAGIVSMIIAGGTIVSSLFSDRLTSRMGTGLLTALSVLMTALALFGFSVSNSFVVLCIYAIPYGLGAGAVDAALNNYVALHYSSRHMSWLHAFWGVGVSISLYIMSYCLTHQYGWENGYFSVSIIQLVLTAVLFFAVPMWKRSEVNENSGSAPKKLKDVVRLKGVIYCLMSFLCFCGFESTAGLWASSYLVDFRNVDVETAARFGALFYLGITFGRFISGFIADCIGDKRMIRIGIIIMLAGLGLIMLPAETDVFALAGLVIIGLGSAPVYPCIIHSTPTNFGKENSQALVGIQMASAYTGSMFMPPLFGMIADNITISLYPFFLAALIIVMLIMSETMNKKLK